MARSKKTRKVGPIGVAKSEKPRQTTSNPPSRTKKKKGNPAGSRHSQAQQSSTPALNRGNSDPRHGSKKAVPLVVKTVKKSKPEERYFSPRQELKSIENDERLYQLIDLLDAGKVLDDAEQQYVDQKLERHRILCDLLGIQPEEEAEDIPQEATEDDLLDKFDNASLSSYKQ